MTNNDNNLPDRRDKLEEYGSRNQSVWTCACCNRELQKDRDARRLVLLFVWTQGGWPEIWAGNKRQGVGTGDGKKNERSKEALKTTEISGPETREVGNPENKKRLKKRNTRAQAGNACIELFFFFPLFRFLSIVRPVSER